MTPKRIGIITSGGDSPGMNAAIRAVTRCALDQGLEVVGIHEGWQGVLEGGDKYESFGWRSVGGILQLGGTILGTARSEAFCTVDGRRQAVRNLVDACVGALVVIGGDGSLTGALVLHNEWASHLQALKSQDAGGSVLAQIAEPFRIVGLPGSIDNDLFGTDISIGADTALNTIVGAVDRLSSTASAHSRTFIVEVMGRRCGYLALMSGMAAGADWVLIPEEELEPRWHYRLAEALQRGRAAGRRHDIVLLAEGARHPDGLPIRAETLQEALKAHLGLEARVTVLGHVQRGGPPSAFDRVLATRLGRAAVDQIIGPDTTPVMIGLIDNVPKATPLAEVIGKTQEINTEIDQGHYERARLLRGHSFSDSLDVVKTLARAEPTQEIAGSGRIAILTGGPDAPGMNSVLRTAFRLAMNAGQGVVAVRDGFAGLARGDIRDLQWMDVQGWINLGGSELGAVRHVLLSEDLPGVASTIRQWNIRGLIAVGGLETYSEVAKLVEARAQHAELAIPMICVPATINNNLPATETTVGSDTALNNIVDAVDKIKYTAGSTHRAFVVEVMGRQCGYLALVSSIASGAEMEILPEDSITLQDLATHVQRLRSGFRCGKKLGIVIVTEGASKYYDTAFIRRIMEAEASGAFDVRQVILGHLQRGGVPTAFDRIQGSRLGAWAAWRIMEDMAHGRTTASVVGIQRREVVITELSEAMSQMDWTFERPQDQMFLRWRGLADTLAKPGPGQQDGPNC